MDMNSMSMSMTATSSGAMASSTSDMSGHGSMDSSMMSMADMVMTFFTSTSTPLYSEGWTPDTTGQYVGTCIFLIVLAVLFRGIIAIRQNFAALLVWYSYRKDTPILRSDLDDKVRRQLVAGSGRPWNINEALARACLDTVLAGVSYLLMLAVMTMNVGYFMSILGGTFLGSFVIGDWTPRADHCDGH
ncbi:uncharacterized protein MYCFIDRAFT_210875 [Pseudocercospora fijiensis CIRAD86]|uniref:Copper transport protein n=1 Tax=Pseudocercospora fijiensis (strain CIRAD86) TaxID=383855 RepID=M2ZZU4_PSEFD|nr:uncharacterized protein MYCFIDRAFT_210875 [Pseudocercospora fijiensis CIRAD86]EME84434.1 hypothetical protein MYCFIDRAFT_210875 [Pseudocercospora fijiensis CIRAD86]